jgi:hypothetical protein
MKIKNINLSFFVLFCLISLSFAWYVGATNNNGTASLGGAEQAATTTTTDTSNASGITADLAQKISALTNSSNSNKSVSLDDIQALVDKITSDNSSLTNADTMPQVSKADVHIKKQNYVALGTEKAKAKKKADFIDYITAVTYIFSSNSPTPITSLTNASNILSGFVKTISSAITTQNTSGLEALIISQGKIVSQLKDMEVPEDLVDVHIKALSLALYSQQLANSLKPNTSDPIGEIANLSKIDGFISASSDFMSQVQAKFSEYGVSYDETIQKKLKNYGIDAPANLDALGITTNTSANANSTSK